MSCHCARGAAKPVKIMSTHVIWFDLLDRDLDLYHTLSDEITFD